ncbi:YvcK family protein [Patescibacteria group bacterium]|nr:MAG: YvcK family protein [Patescibacteria group bacterium]
MEKKIVVIGGGNGSAICLDALKRNADLFDITGVISTADSGGSSGRLRDEFGILPPGDILRAILSLSKYDYQILRQIFYSARFSGAGKLDGHNLGNIFLSLGTKYGGDFLRSLSALAQAVEARGNVYPVTLKPTRLCAELTNGKVIKGEAVIDTPDYNRKFKIKKVWLEPSGKAYEKAVRAIRAADYIILSPGSLYTSLVATLLPNGTKEAVKASKAKLIYVESAYRAEGETGPECLSSLVSELEKYLPRRVDMIIRDAHKLNSAQKKYFQEKKWASLEFDKENLRGRSIKSFSYRDLKGALSPGEISRIFKKILV